MNAIHMVQLDRDNFEDPDDARNSRRCRHLSGSLNEYINCMELLRLINRRTCPRSDDERSLLEVSSLPAASSLEQR